MGYKIDYGPWGKTEAAWHRRTHRKKMRAFLVVLIAAVLTVLLLRADSGKVQQLLIPGNPEITAAAFSQLTEDVKAGEAVGDAFGAFCKQIIANSLHEA